MTVTVSRNAGRVCALPNAVSGAPADATQGAVGRGYLKMTGCAQRLVLWRPARLGAMAAIAMG